VFVELFLNETGSFLHFTFEAQFAAFG
jgi:hypothetical protein